MLDYFMISRGVVVGLQDKFWMNCGITEVVYEVPPNEESTPGELGWPF